MDWKLNENKDHYLAKLASRRTLIFVTSKANSTANQYRFTLKNFANNATAFTL